MAKATAISRRKRTRKKAGSKIGHFDPTAIQVPSLTDEEFTCACQAIEASPNLEARQAREALDNAVAIYVNQLAFNGEAPTQRQVASELIKIAQQCSEFSVWLIDKGRKLNDAPAAQSLFGPWASPRGEAWVRTYGLQGERFPSAVADAVHAVERLGAGASKLAEHLDAETSRPGPRMDGSATLSLFARLAATVESAGSNVTLPSDGFAADADTRPLYALTKWALQVSLRRVQQLHSTGAINDLQASSALAEMRRFQAQSAPTFVRSLRKARRLGQR